MNEFECHGKNGATAAAVAGADDAQHYGVNQL